MDLLSGPVRSKLSVSLLVLLGAGLLSCGCSKAVNSPEQVSRVFVEALRSGSTATLDTLVDWERVVLQDNYVTDSYFSALGQSGKDSVTASYRAIFRDTVIPLFARAKISIVQVAVMRKEAEGWLEIEFQSQSGQIAEANKCSISLVYRPNTRHWRIVDLGKVLELARAGVDYDSKHYYLQQPANP
ncbi:hypothetical protein LLH00_10050 [bacterium]|nr:hypothetical protein [bacterium]